MKTRIFALTLASGMLLWGINTASFAQDNASKKTTKTTKTETKVEHKKSENPNLAMKQDTTSAKHKRSGKSMRSSKTTMSSTSSDTTKMAGKTKHHMKHKSSKSKTSSDNTGSNNTNSGNK